jgi:hypothetical protein
VSAAVTPLRAVPRPAVHHTLTGCQVDLICRAADLDDWSGGRGEHPVEVSDAPLAALERHGRRLGTGRCLAVAGLVGIDWDQMLAGIAAVAPALHRDLLELDLIWWEPERGVRGAVAYLLGIEVTR